MKGFINKIINNDCLKVLEKIEDNSIDLIITSPPYNVGVNYDRYDDLQDVIEYIKFITEVAKELYRVIKVDGRACINVPCDGKMKINGHSEKCDISYIVKKVFYESGFKFRDKIYWDKENIKSRTAWGSFESASDPNILLKFEEIIVFFKESKKKIKLNNNINEIIDRDFVKYSNGHWVIPGEKRNSNGCPAPFPQEIPRRLIELYSYRGDIVLDPFSGNGTTCVVAKKLGRNYIGIELSEKYFQYSIKRIEKL